MANLYKQITKHLKKNNCEFKRAAKGSHEIWKNAQTNKSFTVPRSCKAAPTLRAICKQAGIGIPSFLMNGTRHPKDHGGHPTLPAAT